MACPLKAFGVVACLGALGFAFPFMMMWLNQDLGKSFLPRSIDCGAYGRGPCGVPIVEGLAGKVALNVLLFYSWSLPHSYFARMETKKRLVPSVGNAYRSLYVFISCVVQPTLLFMFWQPVFTEYPPIYDLSQYQVLFNVASICGFLFLMAAGGSADVSEHFGVYMAFGRDYGVAKAMAPPGVGTIMPEKEEDLPGDPALAGLVAPFTDRMALGMVRHPAMLAFVSWFYITSVFTWNRVFFLAMAHSYMEVAVVFFEEKDMITTFGDQYIEYQQRVDQRFPFVGTLKQRLRQRMAGEADEASLPIKEQS